MRAPLGLVIAMKSEADAIIGRRGWQPLGSHFRRISSLGVDGDLITLRSGIGWHNAETAARRLVELGAGALLNLGLSGGLSPDLEPGVLIVADRCLLLEDDAPRGSWSLSAAIGQSACRHLKAAGGAVRTGSIVSTREAALSTGRKAMLFNTFGALAVDMESAAIAAVADQTGLPCLICRAVCDPVGQSIPSPLLSALAPNGDLRPGILCAAVMRRPWILADMVHLARQSARARKALLKAWRVLVSSGAIAAMFSSQSS